MYRKIAAVVIALILVLASALVLTSCGSEQGGSGNASGNGNASSSESTSGSENAGSDDSSSGKQGELTVEENGSYDQKNQVAEYLAIYKRLPKNYITKKEARKLGWEGGSVERVAPGKAIGGDRFMNYEKNLPVKKSRKYYECDIDTLGKKSRGPKRIVYSNDGLIYYTINHFQSFRKMPQSA